MRKLVIMDLSGLMYVGQFKSSVFTLKSGKLIGDEFTVPQILAGGTSLTLDKMIRKMMTEGSKGNTVDFVVCADSKHYFRKDIYKYYKSSRNEKRSQSTKMNVTLDAKLFQCIADRCNITCLEQEGYEADDLIASTVTKLKADYDEIELVAEDSDLTVLIEPGIQMVGIRKDYKPKKYTERAFYERVSLHKAIDGDPKDDIPKLYLNYYEKTYLNNLSNKIVKNKDVLLAIVKITDVLSDRREDIVRNIELAYPVTTLEIPKVLKQPNISMMKKYIKDLYSPIIADSEKDSIFKEVQERLDVNTIKKFINN